MEEVPVSLLIESELMEPVPVPEREIRPLSSGGAEDIGLLLTDYDESLGLANSRLRAIRTTTEEYNQRLLRLRCDKVPNAEACDSLP